MSAPHPGASAVRMRAAFCIVLLASSLACGWLAWITWSTEWTMDADEAVHAVEALRLADRLEQGELAGFLRDTYFPERWQPPVNDHVRWYPFVHSWTLLPGFLVFGPSDFTARVPSIVFLFGSCLLLFELGRRLAPTHRAASAMLGPLLLLASPNVLTFSAQSLIEPVSLLTCLLALLAYVWAIDVPGADGRAARGDVTFPRGIIAGLALGLAILTKYDHGGLLALCLGLAELGRLRFNVWRMLRTGSGLLFVLALACVLAWFAHPDKLEALKDSASHPFFGSTRLIFLDFVLTWFTEYGSGIAMGGLAAAAVLLGWRRWGDPRLRALWLWIALTTVFLALRARYHFRYNFVEAPAALLLAAVLVPEWIACWSAGLAAETSRFRQRFGTPALLLGVLASLLGAWMAVSPGAVFDLLGGGFGWFYDLREDHWGMTLPADSYVEHYALGYRRAVVYGGGSLLALGLGLLVAGTAALALDKLPGERSLAPTALVAALAIALAPGALRLHANLPDMVEWELECHPEFNEVNAFLVEETLAQVPTTLLLGGGWDQFTNNGVRWYLLIGADRDLAYDDVDVRGDMIGSIVFPPEPRIAYWAEVLGTADAAELPDQVVLAKPGPDFLYLSRMGPEVAIYGEILASRGGYALTASRTFPLLDCTLEVHRRDGTGPAALAAEDVAALLARHGIEPGVAGNASRFWVGENEGWAMRDESLRHFMDHREPVAP